MARTFGAAFLWAGAFYLLLIDNTTSPELYAGAGATALAAAVTAGAYGHGLRGARPRARWLLAGWRAVATIPADIVRVSVAAVQQLVAPRPVRGRLRAVPFHHGARADGGDMARRALAEAMGSLSPNTIVIGIDEEHDLILAHQLRPTGGAETIDMLGLG